MAPYYSGDIISGDAAREKPNWRDGQPPHPSSLPPFHLRPVEKHYPHAAAGVRDGERDPSCVAIDPTPYHNQAARWRFGVGKHR